MSFTNIEIKACTKRTAEIRNYLISRGADFKGIDHQTDTYFNVISGRMKLRQGNIENSLIFYERKNETGPKESNFHLIQVQDADRLKDILDKALGVKVVVNKVREIYYIENVKFHLDSIDGLGHFVEIEAGNLLNPSLSKEELLKQCRLYMDAFSLEDGDCVKESYSEMIFK